MDGRCEILNVLSEEFILSSVQLSSDISSLEGRICSIDSTLIGKSQSWISNIKKFFANFRNSDKKIVGDLVTIYNELKVKQEQLLNPVQVETPLETTPVAQTPQEQLIGFFQDNMPLFNNGIMDFINSHLIIPEGTTIEIEGDTITLPKEVSAGPIDTQQSLTSDEFQTLNRQSETENLALLQGITMPSQQAPSTDPKLKDLTYFRSLGKATTSSLLGGAKLSLSKKVKLKIDGNKVEFLEGGPTVGSGLKTASVTAMILHPLDDSVAKKELGKVEVQSKKGWLSLPSNEYFLADLDRLLSVM